MHALRGNRSAAYSEIEDKVFSIRTNRWRYIYNPFKHFPNCKPYKFVNDQRRYGYVIKEEELYDLLSDPKELVNVINRDKMVGAALKQQLVKWLNQVKTNSEQQKLDEQTLKELRSLGYIQ